MESHASSKCEFQIIGTKGIIFDSDVDDFIQKLGFAVKIFGYTEPETKELKRQDLD